MSKEDDVQYVADLLRECIELGVREGASFIDARAELCIAFYVELSNGIVTAIKQGIERGACIRVLYKGSWGFSTTNVLTKESLVNCVRSALRAAKALAMAERAEHKVYTLPSCEDYVKTSLALDPRNVSIDDKVRDLLEYHREVAHEEYVKSVIARYSDEVGAKVYVSSEGRSIVQEYCYTWFYTWVVGREGPVVASVRDSRGTIDGYTLWRRWPQHEIATVVKDRLRKQLRAKTPKGGVFPVVLAPEVVGTFVHEAFGHLAEADLTLSGSAIRDKMGKKIASELVTIVDDPTIPGAYGTFKYDDEGVEARKVFLIDRGIAKELMVDREYAAKLGTSPTGNARAESYRVWPLIRMRNTVLLSGDYEVDELFEGIEFGYYLVSVRGGQANLDGTFQVGIQEAYEIVNGKVGDPVRNVSISGNTLDTLMEVDAVAKDFSIGYGRCGKGQTVLVSDGGPHIRVRKMIIGGEAT